MKWTWGWSVTSGWSSKNLPGFSSDAKTDDVKINSGDIYFATAGKGIVLGATSNTSANTLSDYETGTYTITATLGSGSVSS